MKALHALLALLCFVSASCSMFGGKKEDPTVEVTYRGNTELSSRELDAALRRFFQDFGASSLKKSAVDDAAYDLERFYQASGFPFVVVHYTYLDPDAEPAAGEPASAPPKPRLPRAVFEIEEGPRVELTTVLFTGNAAVPAKTLESFFTVDAAGLFEDTTRWYDDSDVRSKLGEIGDYYEAHGYLDFTASAPRVEFDEKRTHATVSIAVKEGVLYRVASIDADGGDERIDRSVVQRATAPYIGRPYFERLSIEIQGRIEEVYANAGFADVKVRRVKRVATPEGQVALGFAVQSGPRVSISSVKISGNENTSASFIQSRLELKPGSLYSREGERTSIGRMFRSGIFDRVTLRTPADPSQEKQDDESQPKSVERPLEVEVRESPAIETFVEPGWGSYERLRLSVGARHRNLFGTGRILDFRGTAGAIAQSGRLSLIDPWLLGSDVIADLSLFANRRQEPSFLRVEVGTGVSFTRSFSSTVEGVAGYQFRRSDAANVTVLDQDALALTEQLNISELITGLTHDTRDNLFEPTQGGYQRATLEYGSSGIGSELEFFRVKGQVSQFVPIAKATTLGATFKGGLILPLATTDVIPLQERFFNGGENTVRSFEEAQLGPKDSSGNPIGGEAYTVFSVELRRRLKGKLEGACFWDLGNVTEDHADVFKFDGYGQALGLGLRYSLPVGPIRIDAGWNPNPGESDPTITVHFSLGMAF
jgi:outer membrane protein insertion porin family